MQSPETSILALGDRNRLMLLRLLMEQPCSVGELTNYSGLGQSLVSHHLAVLVRQGWLAVNQAGRQRIYRTDVAGTSLASLARWIRRHIDLPPAWRLKVHPQESTRIATRRGDLEDYLL